MNPIKFSICIPTYNRAKYLHDCLERCVRDVKSDFPFEIVVSDNASTDDTTEVVQKFIGQGAPIRYFKGETNVGMIPNMNSAFRLARGEYLLYLADDDRLIGDEIDAIVHYMDENRNLTACYAPWHITDGVTDIDKGVFYELEKDTIYPKRSFAEVFNLMIQRHIFPEIGIYRNSAFRAAWVPREICHFCFPMLAHMLDQGDIAFRKKPFYRQVIRSAIGNRTQGGHHLAMTAWDTYRGGLEYFLYFGIKRGKIGTSVDDRHTQEYLCRQFTLERMAVAIRLLISQNKDYLKSYELYTRMEFGGRGDHAQLAAIRDGLPLAVALQTLAWQVNATAGVSRLIISGFPDSSIIKERLLKVNFPSRVEIVDEPAEHAPELVEHAAVLVSSAEHRERFVTLGYLPNLVFSQEDLIQTVLL
ncbi:glycosyltransferase family 2 protein [Neorhizobium petrolearium]|uniref:glycosyltransferase family 2 protein n=1 Tax=Neorhizobium petrolearium TaxID=515361 RepID=UPI003F14A32D